MRIPRSMEAQSHLEEAPGYAGCFESHSLSCPFVRQLKQFWMCTVRVVVPV